MVNDAGIGFSLITFGYRSASSFNTEGASLNGVESSIP
ncbi:hypothetical protein CJA_3035 [Cellvibrio japonicus Ueda107]|uniref:Uncharacterized protein n=1 Tax=Cellvibrio japonicus (strain Ueda107) TaxID=498211 RepID=B3PD77_CELJU|nr:hypothetical protein CJA_3035 [Cellvibrio japonicus Ueda107]